MKIGQLYFNNLLALAPMENVTDGAFRLICKNLGADMVYTEFTSSEALIRNIPKAMNKIRIAPQERPAAIQIFGNNEYSITRAITMAQQYQPDVIDINCGCWNKNHALRGEGAGLLRDIPRLENILRSAVKATMVPVTVKTRLGWDEKSINILDVAKIIEQSGVQALAVHCRTRSQGYKGRAEWHWLEKIKKVITIPLIGNGDVKSPRDVQDMFATGCDGVMIGRGALANPWIFQQAKHYLTTGLELPPPTLAQKVGLCIQHLNLSVEVNGLRDGVVTFRKFYAGYFHGIPYAAKLRAELMSFTDPEMIKEKLTRFAAENSLVTVAN